MDNTLLSYLNKRLEKTDTPNEPYKAPGPVITISREVGCSGLDIAFGLAKSLNKSRNTDKWKVLSKEIFQQSARELDLNAEKVARIFKQEGRSAFEEILDAFSDKRFKSEKKIKKTVTDVIRSFAEDGFCIIVGRGGNIIAASIKNSLHVRMVAPLDYRIETIMRKHQCNQMESREFITKVEKERYAYRHNVMSNSSKDPEIFDLTINRSSFDRDMTIRLIHKAIKEKKILDDYKE